MEGQATKEVVMEYGLWSSSFLDGNERVAFFSSVTGSQPN
ncbi:hypothetical protein V6Z12_D02G176900 [Gossypium hirsutum]